MTKIVKRWPAHDGQNSGHTWADPSVEVAAAAAAAASSEDIEDEEEADEGQVWSLTQLYSVESRIGV